MANKYYAIPRYMFDDYSPVISIDLKNKTFIKRFCGANIVYETNPVIINPSMKYHGYDIIVFHGRSIPYIMVDDLLHAEYILGCLYIESQKKTKSKLRKKLGGLTKFFRKMHILSEKIRKKERLDMQDDSFIRQICQDFYCSRKHLLKNMSYFEKQCKLHCEYKAKAHSNYADSVFKSNQMLFKRNRLMLYKFWLRWKIMSLLNILPLLSLIILIIMTLKLLNI